MEALRAGFVAVSFLRRVNSIGILRPNRPLAFVLLRDAHPPLRLQYALLVHSLAQTGPSSISAPMGGYKTPSLLWNGSAALLVLSLCVLASNFAPTSQSAIDMTAIGIDLTLPFYNSSATVMAHFPQLSRLLISYSPDASSLAYVLVRTIMFPIYSLQPNVTNPSTVPIQRVWKCDCSR